MDNIEAKLREAGQTINDLELKEIVVDKNVPILSVSHALSICNEAVAEKDERIKTLVDTILRDVPIIEELEERLKYDGVKCDCGNKSTGNTTISCCNVCGLPLLSEPWDFPLKHLLAEAKKEGMREVIDVQIFAGRIHADTHQYEDNYLSFRTNDMDKVKKLIQNLCDVIIKIDNKNIHNELIGECIIKAQLENKLREL